MLILYNIEITFKQANPCDVDVNSGCKNEQGIKDKEKVKNLCIMLK